MMDPRHEKTAPTCIGAAFGRVARAGVEPATSHFSGERSYQLSYLAETVADFVTAERFCDPDGTRTRDLRRDRATR